MGNTWLSSIVYQLPRAARAVENASGRVRIAKALIVYQSQGGGGDTLWREWREEEGWGVRSDK